MDAAASACAPSGVAWDGINWADVQRQVRRLQTRIVKWTQVGKHNKVKALQWLLTHSFSGKALAVKRVTENKGLRHDVACESCSHLNRREPPMSLGESRDLNEERSRQCNEASKRCGVPIARNVPFWQP
jgi:hypothetical protein